MARVPLSVRARSRRQAAGDGRVRNHRERLIKIGARVIEHIARIRIQLPTSCPQAADQ
jgi:hypothetical protein